MFTLPSTNVVRASIVLTSGVICFVSTVHLQRVPEPRPSDVLDPSLSWNIENYPPKFRVPSSLLKKLNWDWGSFEEAVELSTYSRSLLSPQQVTSLESVLTTLLISARRWESASAQIIAQSPHEVILQIPGEARPETLSQFDTQIHDSIGNVMHDLLSAKIFTSFQQQFPTAYGIARRIEIRAKDGRVTVQIKDEGGHSSSRRTSLAPNLKHLCVMDAMGNLEVRVGKTSL